VPGDDATLGPGLSADELLSVVDHELGNLTTVIVGLASALDRRWDRLTDTDRRDLARRIASQAVALTTLLDNLRQLRTGGAFAHAPTAQQLESDPSAGLLSLAEDLHLAAPDHRVVVEVQPGMPPMRLDTGRLAQVLRNLVSNSAKFAPRGSVIAVRAGLADETLELTVDDCGPGIPREERERVFDKFVQLDPGRPGTGLGLFISRAIIEGLGGEIGIDEPPTGGCRVRIRLPPRAR